MNPYRVSIVIVTPSMRFTRMRFCFTDGRLDMDCKLPPQEVSEDELVPCLSCHNESH